MAMTSKAAFDTPSNTVAVDGEVVVLGPDGVGHAFTPGAARETGRRLQDTRKWQKPLRPPLTTRIKEPR